MRIPLLISGLFLVVLAGAAAYLDNWRLKWEGDRQRNDSFLVALFGDGRRLFANHFFVKADVYFHNGNYPSVFDHRENRTHLSQGAAGIQDEDDGHDLGKPLDWIEAFGRNFYPSRHTHINETGGRGPESEQNPQDAVRVKAWK